MKKIIFFIILLLFVFAQRDYAQIYVRTPQGRSVILNADKTWKYTDSVQKPTDCLQAHTGTITVVNKYKSDIYFCYAINASFAKYLFSAKVKAGEKRIIPDVHTGSYSWKAVLEKAAPDIPLDKMEGISKGILLVTQCADKEVEVDE